MRHQPQFAPTSSVECILQFLFPVVFFCGFGVEGFQQQWRWIVRGCRVERCILAVDGMVQLLFVPVMHFVCGCRVTIRWRGRNFTNARWWFNALHHQRVCSAFPVEDAVLQHIRCTNFSGVIRQHWQYTQLHLTSEVVRTCRRQRIVSPSRPSCEHHCPSYVNNSSGTSSRDRVRFAPATSGILPQSRSSHDNGFGAVCWARPLLEEARRERRPQVYPAEFSGITASMGSQERPRLRLLTYPALPFEVKYFLKLLGSSLRRTSVRCIPPVRGHSLLAGSGPRHPPLHGLVQLELCGD